MKWYWIVLIVVAVLIALAIGIPTVIKQRSARRSANWWGKFDTSDERAISTLRDIASAQKLYKSRYGCYGDYFDLNNWKERKYISPWVAMADPDHPQHSDWFSFTYDISVNADNSDWCCIATPGRFWEKGPDNEKNEFLKNYRIGSNDTVYFNETEGNITNFPKVLREDHAVRSAGE